MIDVGRIDRYVQKSLVMLYISQQKPPFLERVERVRPGMIIHYAQWIFLRVQALQHARLVSAGRHW